jgi:hypothetical protein
MTRLKRLLGHIAHAAFDMSITVNRIIVLAYCNLTLAFIVLVVERGADRMKKLSRGVIALLVLALIAIAGSAHEVICFYRQVMGLNM